VRVTATFDNHDRALFPEQFVNVQLLVDTRRGQLVVPAAAIQQGPQGTFTYVVRDGRATMQAVTVGAIEADTASITAGLAAGDLVVTEGVDRLRNGSAVETSQTRPARSEQVPSTRDARSLSAVASAKAERQVGK
jgi:membrane fusion protein, multidrug efflux system